MQCPFCERETPYIRAIVALEALEPYARRLVQEAAEKGEWYERHWSLALQQARLVLAAVDSGLTPTASDGDTENARPALFLPGA